MKKFFSLLIVVLVVCACNSTRNGYNAQISKSIDSVAHLKAVQAVEQGYFVLQANTVSDNYGNIMSGINRDANFILFQNDKGMFQIADLRVDPGLNGIGGITLEGYTRDVKIKKGANPNDEVNIQFMLIGSDVNATVFITLFRNSDQATATVSPTLGSGNITMRGQLIPYRSDISINP